MSLIAFDRTIKVGVCGVGSLGEHHARLYSEMPEAELVGVFDANPHRAQDVAARYHTRVFDRLEALAEAVEAVSVVVPTDRHHAVAARLIEAGRHVLIEKPIAATIEEAEDLVARATARGVLLQVGHVEHFNPVLSTLDTLRGPPRFIEAHRLAPYPPPRPGAPPRGTEVSVVLDLMIHDLDIILHVVKAPVAEVRAVGLPVLSAQEDIANARLAFANGCVANVTASRVSAERLRKIRLFYPEAYVSLDYMNQTGEICRRVEGALTRSPIPIEREEPLRAELAAFLRCVREGRTPPVTGERGVEALRLAFEIIRRARECPG